MKVLAFLVSALLVGCSVSKNDVRRILQENPEYVFEAIDREPAKFMAAYQSAATKQRQVAMAEQKARSAKLLDDALKNPVSPDLAPERATIGSKTAPITLVVYSDFQCPFCKRGFLTVREIMKKHSGRVQLVYKHLPLTNHAAAMPAALRFEAIAKQDPHKAFQFHDRLFEAQDQLAQNAEMFMDKTAKELGVNLAKMRKEMMSPVVAQRIESDRAEAKKFGITGTPSFVVNGVLVKGAKPIEVFDQIIQKTAPAVVTPGE